MLLPEASLTIPSSRTLLLIACAAVLALGAAACGGGGDSKNATPTGIAETPVAPNPTLVPTAALSGDHVDSKGVGYEVTQPQGWRLHANVIQSAQFRGDGFFKNDNSTPDPSRVQTNISIGCQDKLPETGTIEDEAAFEVKGLQQLKRENIRVSDHAPVDGRPAKQIDFVYRLNASGPTPVPPTPAPPSASIVADQRLVLFISDTCVWKVTLIATQGELDREVPVLDQMLSTLKVHA